MRAFIIHGFHGVPDDAWKPWLKSQLEAHSFKVMSPQMPEPASPRLDQWVKTIAQAVKTPDKDCVFVGHSLGCAAILRYLEGMKESVEFAGAVFIAGFATSLNPEMDSFFAEPFDWEAIRHRCRDFVSVVSDDDPHVAMVNGDIFRRSLGARLIVHTGMKHFGSGDGVTELPSVLETILDFVVKL